MAAATIQQTDEPGLQADQRLVDRGWLRIGAGTAIAAQAMVFSLAINLSEIEGWAYAVVHGILILAAVGSLVFLGGDLVRSAWESIREHKIGIDLLFLITLAGAFAGSLVSTFTRTGSVYYEVVAILIVVHTTGKMLGARSRMAALRAVDTMRERFDSADLVKPDGSVERTKVGELPLGSRVRVAPGGAISVDGVIVSGRGYVQETSMTGEWRLASRGPGDRVLAGTFSVDGSFEVQVDGGARRLDAILGLVERARLAPSRLQQEADRLTAWFLPLVVGVSMGTFFWWYFHGPWDRALFNAMAVLLVACPCAMGLATPVAVWSALARLAQFGLVARTGDFIDALARIDTLCIDKTGTLSADSLEVKSWRMEPAFAGRETWLKCVVAAVEEGLTHPAAEALREKYHLLRDTFPRSQIVKDRQIVPGLGVVAEVDMEDGGRAQLAVGEKRLGGRGRVLEPANAVVGSTGAEDRCHLLSDIPKGKEIYVFVDGNLSATIVIEERWRAGMDEALEALRGLGLAVEVMSGDPGAAEFLPADLIVRGGLTPAQKHVRVEELVQAGKTVLFVGDGINDAAAMSAAHASIAMRAGAELARASAMAVFVGDDLRFLPRAIAVARATRKGIRVNLIFAAAYNLAGMALAAAGMLHPVAAALLMVGSSLFVSVRSLRASREEAVYSTSS